MPAHLQNFFRTRQEQKAIVAFVSGEDLKRKSSGHSAVEKIPQKQLKQFCANLKRLRAKSCLSQESLAELAEISPRYLQFVEAGKFGVSFAVLLRLRRALKCDWDDLLAGLD
jgi:DNA-binding XRE family transcriptional regulator